MTLIVLLGAPGAGKGTQATVLTERLGIPHVATGDILRAAIRAGTEVGLEAKRYMDRGELVPDDLVIRILEARLDQPDAAAGAILDGFPRTAVQAQSLDAFLDRRGSAVDAALYIDVPADRLVERLSGRRVCEANGHPYHLLLNPPRTAGICDEDGSPLIQRADDHPDTIRARLASQLGDLNDVIDHYRASGVLRAIDGDQDIEAVTTQLVAAFQAEIAERATW